MSIVTSIYEIDSDRHVVERHTDSLGKEYMQTWYAPINWTTEQIEQKLADHALQIEISLAEGEAEELIQQ